ncbi:MAG TPA: hypothetical protein VMU17_07455, partial [Elusimicrobiota bacterium]|nr:hypothetical protein [Elusimicrobiota bacterium]
MGRILTVIGPHEGVGKTTLAANLAVRSAQLLHRPAILIDTDLLCRGETGQISGTNSSTSVYQILEQLASKQLTVPMLRGRIPMNRLGIGALNLAASSREMEQMSRDQWAFFLQSFAQVYDVIIDMEIAHPLKAASLDQADGIVWTFVPNPLSVRATVQQLTSLQNEKLGLHKLTFVLNHPYNAPGLSAEVVADSLARFDKELAVVLPYENDLPRLLNAGKPAISEGSRSDYYAGIGQLLDKLAKFKREGEGFGIPGGMPGRGPRGSAAGPLGSAVV